MLVRDAPPAQLPELGQVYHLRAHELLELPLRVRQLLLLLLLLVPVAVVMPPAPGLVGGRLCAWYRPIG